jgi:two-component system response regulator FixJ
MMHRDTIVIIDDDTSVQTGLARLLFASGFRARSYQSAEAFLAEKDLRGGCILLDLCMPGINGLELQEVLSRRGCALPIIFLTGHGDIPTSVLAVKRGAYNFLTKPVDEADLLKAIEEALKSVAQRQNEIDELEDIRSRVAQLTAREEEVMRFVISGALNKQIAFQLGIAEKTVKVHRARVLEKMEADSLADLVRFCQAIDIVPAQVST